MDKLYKIFDMEPVVFDDRKSVKELIEFVFNQSNCCEPAGMNIVTIYDASNYHVITDTSVPCYKAFASQDNIGHGRNGLCLAYYLPNLFFYAEGGWGKHMIEMDVVENISNPVAIDFRFADFRNTVVLNGKLTIRQIYNYLLKANYIEKEENIFKFYEKDYGLPDYDTCKICNATSNDGEKSIQTICKKINTIMCYITKAKSDL